MDTTDFRELRTYALGDENWDHTDTVQAVEEDVPITDVLANRPSSDVPEGRKFLAEDARILYQYRPTDNRADGDGWVPIAGLGSETEPVYGTAHLENLEVTEGLTSRGDTVATRRSTKTLDVLEYGADGDSDATTAADADAAVEAAAADADAGDVLLFRDETFHLSESHTFGTPVDLEFVDADVVDDRPTDLTPGSTLFRWQGPGSQAETTLSTAVQPGNDAVTVDATGFAAAGDTLYLRDDSTGEPRTQFATVQATTDNGDGTSDLEVVGVTRREFAAGAAVHRVELWDGIRVAGADVTTAHPEGEIFAFEWCHRPRVRDVLAREIGRHTVQFADCYDPVARDCEARNAHQKGSGQGEPFISFRSTDVTWSNIRTQGTRRGIDSTLGTTGVFILDPVLEDATKGGVTAHDGDDVVDVTVVGGKISTTDPNDGACIHLDGAVENVSVYGTTLVAHRKALEVAGSADVRDVSIQLADLPSADPTLIIADGDDVSISADVEIPTYTDYVQAATVTDGVSNVDLDLDVRVETYAAGGNENPLVGVSSGASDVTLSGTLDSVADLGAPAVRLYGASSVIENVAVEDLTVVDHGGQGVQFRGDAGVRSIRVSESFLDVAGDGVRWYQYDTLGTCENFWIRDNEILSSGGVGVNVAATAADTVRILDNESTVDVAEGATNIIRHRAEVDKDETVTGAWTFGGTLALASDLQADDGTTIYDHSAGHLVQAALENDSVTVAGNTVALGGSTAIAHGDLSDAPPAAHHSRYADSEAVAAVENAGALAVDLADLAAKPHSALDDAPASAHHSRYSDEEAQDAVGGILSSQFTYDDAAAAINMDPHVGDAAAHHSRYADSEAIAAADSQVDAAAATLAALDDAVAGHHSDTANPHGVTAAQAGALPVAGGQMDGKIEFGGGNNDIRLWEILGPSDSQDYGFYARYRGDLNGVENRFELWSHNQTGTDTRVYGIDQDGAVTFDQTISAGGGAISSQTNADGNYELTIEGDTYTFVK